MTINRARDTYGLESILQDTPRDNGAGDLDVGRTSDQSYRVSANKPCSWAVGIGSVILVLVQTELDEEKYKRRGESIPGRVWSCKWDRDRFRSRSTLAPEHPNAVSRGSAPAFDVAVLPLPRAACSDVLPPRASVRCRRVAEVQQHHAA